MRDAAATTQPIREGKLAGTDGERLQRGATTIDIVTMVIYLHILSNNRMRDC